MRKKKKIELVIKGKLKWIYSPSMTQRLEKVETN